MVLPGEEDRWLGERYSVVKEERALRELD